ncbi:hypothetical protein J7T55_002647 [Diaporthe amygdali]|uniref:uncharacterized protein n=1 Tax=Phomopsis amygdali TaxID=1214568 RepID=UPI0022FE8D38|nr:uncharacterized protein J7T55_002647 [Diaporthe amygdali]KAJ0122135.1 hypothetical protein J7T55_002647 [Diaporthe amygdali]
MGVEKGDKVFIPADTLSEAGGRKVAVKWSQSFKDRSEDYYVSKYTNKSGNGEDLVFVQASKLNELAAKSQGDEKYTLVIDDAWQYGQQKDGSKRFLVYHDKNNKPYQHRFVENFIKQAGGKAVDVITGLGYPADKIEDIASRFVGDYLKTF